MGRFLFMHQLIEESANIVFDLDDTLCSTRYLFTQALNEASLLLANLLKISRDQALKLIEGINNSCFETYGVNPNRWQHVISELVGYNPKIGEISEQLLNIFSQIYTTPLVLRPDSSALLLSLKQGNKPIHIVTHANKDWTNHKYSWLDLDQFLPRNRVYIVDENGHKDTQAWKKAFQFLGIQPRNCMVVGDSPRSDILPCHQNGVARLCLLVDPNQWSVHKIDLPPKVLQIRSLLDLLD